MSHCPEIAQSCLQDRIRMPRDDKNAASAALDLHPDDQHTFQAPPFSRIRICSDDLPVYAPHGCAMYHDLACY